MTEEHRMRLAIDHILSSRHIGFYRLCGRELQVKYRAANLTKNNPDRKALLDEIIETYDYVLDTKQPPMALKEKKFKKKLIRAFARKNWEDRH